MEPKVLPFSTRDFKKAKHPPLTLEMIYALLLALQKQERKIPFGPGSIKGLLNTLIERGLIVQKKYPLQVILDINGRLQRQRLPG